MQEKIDALTAYFSTNGSLADAVAFTQLVASDAWGQIAKLYNVMQGVL
jgi:hypothetical protein